MMKKQAVILLLFLVMIGGCSQKMPKPRNVIDGIQSHFEIKTAASTGNNEHFTVKSFVKGSSVYVECYVSNYSFSQTNTKDMAKIVVFIDGNKHSERTTAAFIIKDLPSGRHTLKLDILNGEGKKTGLTKEFVVHI